MKIHRLLYFFGGLSLVLPAVSHAAMEEVVVTATKRDTSLQDTPLAISAFGQEALNENHVSNIYDLRGMVPSLQIRSNGDHDVPLIFIRGQGAVDQTEAGDQAVAFYTDNVFAARSQGSLALMYDLDHVEVLRGPQGTLFGRNSTAGAVSLITAKPKTDAFAGSGALTVGSRNKQEMQFMLNVPMSDTWALRFAGVTSKQEGDTNWPIDSQFVTYRNYGTKDLQSYRISSMYSPSDTVDWFLSYENYSNQGTGDVPSTDFEKRQQYATVPGAVDLVSDIVRTRLDIGVGESMTLSYIGGFTNFSQAQRYGNQFQGDFRDTVWSTHEADQHEFQLKNSDDAAFRWTAGAFVFSEDNGIRFDIPHGSWNFTPQDSGTVLSTFVQPSRTLDSTSFYFQGTYDLTDTFRITAGARSTDDTREDQGGRSIDCTYDPGRGPLPTIVGDASLLAGGQGCYYRQINDMKGDWSDTTYMVRAEWDSSEDIMWFVSYATGWKSGVLADGQNTRLTQGGPFNVVNTNESPDTQGNALIPQQPESNSSLEIGLKSRLLDGRMTFNANLFLMDYEDMQVTSAIISPFTGQSTLTKTNAGSSSINGIEFEMSLEVGESGLLQVSGALLDATYDEFLSSENIFGDDRGRNWNPCAYGVVPNDTTDNDNNGIVGQCVGGVFDFSGNTLPNAPEYAFDISYKYDIALSGGGKLTPRIRLNLQDDTYLTYENRGDRPAGTRGPTDPGESNFDVQESYAKWDISLGYSSSDERWGAEAYINNVTNEEVKQETFFFVTGNSGNESAFVWGPAREAGLRLHFNFE